MLIIIIIINKFIDMAFAQSNHVDIANTNYQVYKVKNVWFYK